eukprot:308597_1
MANSTPETKATRMHLMLSGYIRHIASILSMPKDIYTLVYLYQFRFEFNSELCSLSEFNFSLENQMVQYSAANTHCRTAILVSNNILSANDGYKKIEWEIKIESKFNLYGYSFHMGFIQYPSKDSIKLWNKYLGEQNRDKQFSIAVYEHIYSFGGHLDNFETNVYNQTVHKKSGDFMTLIFDFTKKNNNICLYFNKKYIGIVYKDLPKRIIPAVSFYNANIKQIQTASVTKWNILTGYNIDSQSQFVISNS